MTRTDPAPGPSPQAPAARLQGWDSIELWVGNARAMAGFLSAAFGFRVTAYAGPETGVAEKASYLLEQGEIRLAVTAGLTPDSPIWTHVREHGDGAHDLAFVVDDATATFEAAVARGARPVEEPYELADDDGVLRLSSVATYGETKHTFVDRSSYRGWYCPGYAAAACRPSPWARRSDWSPSTTSWATSRKAASTSGSRSTRT